MEFVILINILLDIAGKGLGMNVSALPAGHMLGGCMWRITREGEDVSIGIVDFI